VIGKKKKNSDKEQAYTGTEERSDKRQWYVKSMARYSFHSIIFYWETTIC